MKVGLHIMPVGSQEFTGDLKGRLDKYLKSLEQRGYGDRHRFIPRKVLRQLFTQENLNKYLERYQPDVGKPKELASYIQDAAQQTFAILLLIDEAIRISALKVAYPKASNEEAGISETGIDETLFKGPDGGAKSRSYCSMEKLEGITQLRDIARSFDEKQYLFPPFLSKTDTPKYDPMRFVFPFIFPNESPIGEGGFGTIYEVEIEDDYIEYPEDDQSTVVACKVLPTTNDWESLKREVNVVKERQHAHVTPIYASFIACLPVSGQPRDGMLRLYIILPLAIMDMETWMNDKPNYDEFSDGKLEQHIWNTISGLTSALTYIHREIGGKVGYHGDIKPRNILLFNRSGRHIWKFSDFGSSNLKQYDDTATSNIHATAQWAPKEYRHGFTSPQGQMHGRLGDTWSLGCVFLLLATMLLYRWDHGGVKSFKEQFGKKPFHEDKDFIDKWLDDLLHKAQAENDDHVAKLVVLIKDMLKAQEWRIFSWEVDVDVYCIMHPGASEEDIEDHLKSVVQRSRDVDSKMSHKPMVRAKRHKRGVRYLELLSKRGWTDEQNLERLKTNPTITSGLYHMPEPIISLRTEHITRMSQALSENKRVVLYGLRGIGKSTLARQYWSQKLEQDGVEYIEVNAKSELSIKGSYNDIVARYHSQNHKYYEEETRPRYIKTWLQESTTGPWYMHVYGLEQRSAAIVLQDYLPVLGSNSKGNIVVTTRDRALSAFLVDLRGDNDINIDRPNEHESMDLFRQTLNKRFLGDPGDLKFAQKLLKILGTPDLISKTASYLNLHQRTCREFLQDIEQDGLALIEDIQNDLASHYLVPILVKRIDPDDEWSEALQQIFLLSMFDNVIGVDEDLIFSERDEAEHSKLKMALDTLANCFLIQKRPNPEESDENPSKRYWVDSAVQLAVLAWIEKNEEGIGFLKRFNKALSILYTSYTKVRRGSDNHIQERIIVEYVQHFKHIVRYAKTKMFKTGHRRISFNFNDGAVQAIITFCKVLSENKDYIKDAIYMLELGQSHYSIDSIMQRSDPIERQHGTDLFSFLNHHLVNMTIIRHRSEESQMKALADQVAELCGRTAIVTDGLWLMERTRFNWQFRILLVRVLRESKRYEDARREFQDLEQIRFTVDGSQATLPDDPSNNYHGEELEQLRALVIAARFEEGLLDLDEGEKYQKKNNMEKAREVWSHAHQAFNETRIAADHWEISDFPRRDLELCFAETSVQLGSEQHLDDARSIFDQEHQHLLQTHGVDNVEAWEMEFKLNSAMWKLGGDHKREAKISLEKLIPKFENKFGPDDQRTKDLIALLQSETPPTSPNHPTGRVERLPGNHQAHGNLNSDLGSRRYRYKQKFKRLLRSP